MLRKMLLIMILLLGVLVSCSDDPRIAPLEFFIIRISGNENVMYKEDYGARVLFMQPGENALFEVLTNRQTSLKHLTWTSNETVVATVSPDANGNGVIQALDYGAAEITVTASGHTAVGQCFVIVKGPESTQGVTVTIVPISGLIETSEGYSLYAFSQQELQSKVLDLSFTPSGDPLRIKAIEWYMNGQLVSTEATCSLSLTDFGLHTVNCIIYGKDYNNSLIPLGYQEVKIEGKYM